ncbi:MAG: DUF2231 domain-containing protein [Leptolyngbya sp. LCM1.Bin17]|nr:MAG: DUF2231 domain-containing protein [Leptolyngbya sp. LCM1.Bin17]
MFLLESSLNRAALPYPDPIHPIVVHFVIAMVLFAFLCDVVGHFTKRPQLFEVSFWNMFVATIAVFVAIIFGQFEAGLAPTYPAVQPVLTRHQIIGWSLSAIIATITAWKLAVRTDNMRKVPGAYLGAAAVLSVLILIQLSLGSQLVWVYGLHVRPVVQAIESGQIVTTSEAESTPTPPPALRNDQRP